MELEAWLAERVKYHAVPAHREALKTVLKTYLNGGKPVPVARPEQPAAAVWDDTLDDQ